MNYVLDDDSDGIYHTPATYRLTEMLETATELCDLPDGPPAEAQEDPIKRLKDRIGCRLDKIVAREDISEQARAAVKYLLEDLDKL